MISELSLEQLIKFLELKIREFQIPTMGIDYYNGNQEIEKKIRTAIGEDGRIKILENLPNTRAKDNQYKRAVDQKVNYLFSDIPAVESEDSQLNEILIKLFDKRFLRTLNKIAKDSYNTGIGWLYVYSDGSELKYKQLNPLEIIPIWTDNTHDKLDGVIQIYTDLEFIIDSFVEVKQVRLFTESKIYIFKYVGEKLEYIGETSYLHKNNEFYNFGKIPFVYFKTPTEKSLIYEVKSLQDALNVMISNFVDNMLEDPRNTILVIKNYDGADLGEFRQQLAQYGAVKVVDGDGLNGGIDSLQIEVNNENYESIIRLLKKSIKENARIVDLDDEKSGNPNMLNIKGMYADMELDANQLELEFTASFEYLLYFIKKVYGINESAEANIKLKRNIMTNEEQKIELLTKLSGIISERTLLSEIPYVQNVDEELALLNEERTEIDEWEFNLNGENE